MSSNAKNSHDLATTGQGKSRLYPIVSIERIKNPSRFYAFPIVGGLCKFIILIPVFILLWFGSLVAGVCLLINAFVVLFTGRYWLTAYVWVKRVVNLNAKVMFFTTGLTDKYPGLDYELHDNFKVEFSMPKEPNKLYALPLLGLLFRTILLIPFSLFSSIVQNAVNAMTVCSSFSVLFRGYYPESTFELVRDNVRLQLAEFLYSAGISDTIPTMRISKNHLKIKLFFILIGFLALVINTVFQFTNSMNRERERIKTNTYQQKTIPNNSR